MARIRYLDAAQTWRRKKVALDGWSATSKPSNHKWLREGEEIRECPA